MPDLLVKLYELPELAPRVAAAAGCGVAIRRAMAHERGAVAAWIGKRFGPGWASEAEAAFSRQPVACFLALEANRLVGFACHECTMRGFFGPSGVEESLRGKGIGAALLLASLWDMRAMGYGYAVIGGASEPGFYARVAGAVPIEGSTPGVYPAKLRDPDSDGLS